MLALALDMAHGRRQQRIGGTVLADETARGIKRDMLLEDLAVEDRESRGRQRVDDFVREHNAGPAIVHRALQPFHAREHVRRQAFAQPQLLALAQIGARFEDGVARRQTMRRRQAFERGLGEGAGTAADFHEHRIVAEPGEHRRERVGDAFGEQRPQFGRGDEIAAFPELGRARAVIAQPGRVQRQLHETPERKRAAVARDLIPDQRRKAFAVGFGVRFQIVVVRHAAAPLRGRTG